VRHNSLVRVTVALLCGDTNETYLGESYLVYNFKEPTATVASTDALCRLFYRALLQKRPIILRMRHNSLVRVTVALLCSDTNETYLGESYLVMSVDMTHFTRICYIIRLHTSDI